tara:strand:- start:249 stop:377 length:129 start_codon:yes stop_codon:yes gene_type:complete
VTIYKEEYSLKNGKAFIEKNHPSEFKEIRDILHLILPWVGPK